MTLGIFLWRVVSQAQVCQEISRETTIHRQYQQKRRTTSSETQGVDKFPNTNQRNVAAEPSFAFSFSSGSCCRCPMALERMRDREDTETQERTVRRISIHPTSVSCHLGRLVSWSNRWTDDSTMRPRPSRWNSRKMTDAWS